MTESQNLVNVGLCDGNRNFFFFVCFFFNLLEIFIEM